MSKCLNFITVWFLISCAERSNVIEDEIGFISDAFVFSDTRESQLAVFDSLFFGQAGYELPEGHDSYGTI